MSHAADTDAATSFSDIIVPSSATVRKGPPHTDPTHAPARASLSHGEEADVFFPGVFFPDVFEASGASPSFSALSAAACLFKMSWYVTLNGPSSIPIARVGAQNLSVSRNAPKSAASDAPASSSARKSSILARKASENFRCSEGHSPIFTFFAPAFSVFESMVEYAESSSSVAPAPRLQNPNPPFAGTTLPSAMCVNTSSSSARCFAPRNSLSCVSKVWTFASRSLV